MRYEREDENARIHNVHPVFHPLELKSVSRTMKKQGCAICILVPTSEFFPPSFIFLSCLRLSHLIKQHSLQYLAYSPLATDSPHQHKRYCTLYAFLQVTRKTDTNMLQVLWHGPCNASNWTFRHAGESSDLCMHVLRLPHSQQKLFDRYSRVCWASPCNYSISLSHS